MHCMLYCFLFSLAQSYTNANPECERYTERNNYRIYWHWNDNRSQNCQVKLFDRKYGEARERYTFVFLFYFDVCVCAHVMYLLERKFSFLFVKHLKDLFEFVTYGSNTHSIHHGLLLLLQCSCFWNYCMRPLLIKHNWISPSTDYYPMFDNCTNFFSKQFVRSGHMFSFLLSFSRSICPLCMLFFKRSIEFE